MPTTVCPECLTVTGVPAHAREGRRLPHRPPRRRVRPRRLACPGRPAPPRRGPPPPPPPPPPPRPPPPPPGRARAPGRQRHLPRRAGVKRTRPLIHGAADRDVWAGSQRPFSRLRSAQR